MRPINLFPPLWVTDNNCAVRSAFNFESHFLLFLKKDIHVNSRANIKA